MSEADYDDPDVEARWLTEQETIIRSYLHKEGILHCDVASRPDWFVAPYVSIWHVESPGLVGWWVISGDLPTDYLNGRDAADARGAMRAFAARWREVSSYMLRDEDHPTVRIGHLGNRRELGDLLSRRARIIDGWAHDDEMWQAMEG